MLQLLTTDLDDDIGLVGAEEDTTMFLEKSLKRNVTHLADTPVG